MPEISESNQVLKPPVDNVNNKNKLRALPKAKQYPGVPDNYGIPNKDNIMYDINISSLFGPQKLDCLNQRIKEMEDWTWMLLDKDGPLPQ